MSKGLSILLIEDNRQLASQICHYLERSGLQMDYADNGRTGVALAIENQYDLVILDLMLPDMDGLAVCQKVKQEARNQLPILMLTARDSMDDKRQGFNVGADDYLTKPFELEELALRCQALSRRQTLHQSQVQNVGELQLDSQTRSASRQGQPLKLTQTEFNILEVLALAYPAVVTRSELTRKLWQDAPDSDALRSHIYSLRSRLDKPFSHPMLRTIHGVGFKLEE